MTVGNPRSALKVSMDLQTRMFMEIYSNPVDPRFVYIATARIKFSVCLRDPYFSELAPVLYWVVHGLRWH